MQTITKIDKYFAKKGIKTIFNTMGSNETLIRAYVTNFHKSVDNTRRKFSNHNKISDYSKMYSFQPRHKMTGFENFKSNEEQFKKDVGKFIIESQFSPIQLINNDEHDLDLNYKTQLIEFCKTIENPLLYLSGGMDSELVANSFIEANVPFKVVVFEWLDNNNFVRNRNEIFHAYKFCTKHNIIPIIKQIHIEKLWSSKEFKNLSIDIQILSPHLVTYAHVINLMSMEMPTVTHVFGGDVKFRTNYELDNGQQSNLVWLDKIVPSYDGRTYNVNWAGYQSSAQIALYAFGPLSGSSGSWAIAGSPESAFDPNGGDFDGPFTDTPASYYEFKSTANVIDSVGPYQVFPLSSYTLNDLYVSPASQTSFAPPYYNYNYLTCEWLIDCRVYGETTPVQSSSLTFVTSTLWV